LIGDLTPTRARPRDPPTIRPEAGGGYRAFDCGAVVLVITLTTPLAASFSIGMSNVADWTA